MSKLPKKKKSKTSYSKSNRAKAEFLLVLRSLGIPMPVQELRFHATRRWRFDYAWPEYMLAVEVEGGVWTGGRHIQPKGFLKDMEKYNAAASAGWQLLRFTPKELSTVATANIINNCIIAKCGTKQASGNTGE
jgi:very-short-patch-repair endonuclease